MRQIILAALLGLSSGGCNGLDELVQQDDSESKEGPRDDVDANALQCVEPKPDDGCNTCGCMEGQWVCTLMACAPDAQPASPCDWVVAESFPTHVTGVCTYDSVAESPLIIDLPSERPRSSAFSILLDGATEEFLGFTHDATANQLSLTVDNQVGQPLTVRISYAGSGEAGLAEPD